jgi:hypothetical protein
VYPGYKYVAPTELVWRQSHSVNSVESSGLLEKTRNCKTNPIFVASHYRSGCSEEKISNFMISRTHFLVAKRMRVGHLPVKLNPAKSSRVKASQAQSSRFQKKKIVYFV